jgi:hypothetical protein
VGKETRYARSHGARELPAILYKNVRLPAETKSILNKDKTSVLVPGRWSRVYANLSCVRNSQLKEIRL